MEVEFKKAKTKSQKLAEKGLEIHYCLITIYTLKKKGKNKIKDKQKKVELVYKQTHLNHNEDQFLKARLANLLNLKETPFIIESVEKLKFLGYGIYET